MSYPVDYSSKKVLLFVGRSNFASDSLVEALRFAIGLSCGIVGHKVDVVFIADGVTDCMTERIEEAKVRPYFLSAKSYGISFWVDESSLKQRSIDKERLFKDCNVVNADSLVELLDSSDIHLRL